MSNSPAIPYYINVPAPPPPPPPLPSTGLGLGFGIIGVILVVVAFKYLCKVVIPAGTEPLGHQGGSHAAASATHQQRRSPRRPPDGEQLDGANLDDRQRLPDPTPSLPAAFAYNRSSLKRKVQADTAGEDAAACAVCLGAFEFGEMVRLLPMCLHLYHVECIDPWLRKHSTCPVCRSETDPMVVMDVSQLPPV